MNKCDKCSKEVPTVRGLMIHKSRMHSWRPRPVVVVSPPKKKTEIAKSFLPETLTLLNAKGKLEAGDVFYQTRTFVVRKVTSDTSTNLVVEAEATKHVWSKYP